MGEPVQDKWEADMAALAEAAKQVGDAFRVKVMRRSTNTIGATPLHICSFEEVTKEQLAMAENWLRPVTGGTGNGMIYVVVTPMADPSKSVATIAYAFEGAIPNVLNLKITQSTDWRGPRLSYPTIKGEIPVNASGGNGQAAAPAAATEPRTQPANVSASEWRFQQLERELAESKQRVHQAEMEKVRLEAEKRAQEILEQGRREQAELKASLAKMEAKLDRPPVVAESPFKPFVELLPAFIASQERQAAERLRLEERERERRKEERDEAQKREDRRMEEQRRADEREREDRKFAREEQQRREDRLEAQRREDREREERREDARRAEALETQKLLLQKDENGSMSKVAEGMAAMSSAMMNTAMQSLELTRAAQGGEGENPVVQGIREVLRPFTPAASPHFAGNGASGGQAASEGAKQEVKPTQKAATDAKPDTFIADIVAMVRAKTDVTVVATKFVKDGQNSAALGEAMAHEEVNNDLRLLFVKIMGEAWITEPANMEYAAALAKKLLHIGIGANVFPPQIAEEYGIPLEECGFNAEEVRLLKVRIAAEAKNQATA